MTAARRYALEMLLSQLKYISLQAARGGNECTPKARRARKRLGLAIYVLGYV